MKELLKQIKLWQDETFPEATATSKLHHLKEEVSELIDEIHYSAKISPKNKELSMELADCFLLLFGAADLCNFTLEDIKEAMAEKLDVNKKRKWGKPDKNGVVKHIKS